MTYEEAIKEIRKFERCHYEKPNGDADLKVYEALKMAIEALEKADKLEKLIAKGKSHIDKIGDVSE